MCMCLRVRGGSGGDGGDYGMTGWPGGGGWVKQRARRRRGQCECA